MPGTQANATSFKPGQSGNPKGGKPKKDYPIPGDLAAATREDLHHVYFRPKSMDSTPGQRLYRQIMEKSPARFSEMWRDLLASMEKAGPMAPGKSVVLVADDPAEGRADALIAKLLKECEGV